MPNITKRYIDAARYKGDGTSRDERWDDALPGFGLRISPKGVKTFILFYRVGGKRGARQRLVKLGAYGRDMTPDEARKKAGKWLTAARDGSDPYGKIDEAAKSNTFKDVAADFIELYVRPNKRPRSIAEDERIINGELVPKWGSRRIGEITGRDVTKLLDDIAARPAPIMANRTLAATRKLFKWAAARHALTLIPTDGIEPPGKETKRDRILPDEEIRLLWQVSDKLGWPFGPFVKLLILTGQRRGEVAAMRWADLDLEGDKPVWTLPREATKADRLHTVPLPPLLVDIIKALPRMEGAHVFSTRHEQSADGKRVSRPISGFSKAKRLLDAEIAEAAKNAKSDATEAWTFHDLRRTTASGMARLNISPHILSRVLNHAPGSSEGITAVYNRHAYEDEKRHALNAWAAHVDRIVTDKPADNIVELATA